MLTARLFFDGSTEPTNPGPCRAGASLMFPSGEVLHYSLLVGQGTNNTAEYAGLALGLTKALERGVTHLEAFGDSTLVVKCVNGEWASKQAHLTVHIQYCRLLLSFFDSWELTWVGRNFNIADMPSRTPQPFIAPPPAETYLQQALAKIQPVKVKCKG